MDGRYVSDNTFYHMVGFGILNDNAIAPADKQERCFEMLKRVLNFGFIASRNSDGKLERTEGRISITTNPDGHLRHGDFDGFLAKGNIT